jgi:hypothetical protein
MRIQSESYDGRDTTHEILRAIALAPSKKAPGDDEITNGILKQVADVIMPHLHRIFNACLEEGYCPKHFRNAVTIALRKPGKSTYSAAGSYRPIALLNTIAKLQEFILARRISYLAETHNLLPRTHMGARRAASTEHALHYVLERIYSSWSEGKISTALLRDISGAFDKVTRPRLLHNLRKKGIDNRIVRWIESFLSCRTTILKTNEHITSKIDISVGIPQAAIANLVPLLHCPSTGGAAKEKRRNLRLCGRHGIDSPKQ